MQERPYRAAGYHPIENRHCKIQGVHGCALTRPLSWSYLRGRTNAVEVGARPALPKAHEFRNGGVQSPTTICSASDKDVVRIIQTSHAAAL